MSVPPMWSFRSTPKVAGGRSVLAEETLRRVKPLLRRVPVTRVADLTPLDTIGLPVFSACTPLARDLTLHLGKGADATAARASAIMEAIERFSGESAPKGRPGGPGVVRASFDDLAARVEEPPPIDPSVFELPSDSTYDPAKQIDWMRGYDLLAKREVMVPADVVITPPRDGVLIDVDTNGLASGNLRIEAVVHGLCEVIERDCVSQIDFTTLFSDAGDELPSSITIDPDTLPPIAKQWVDRTREGGLDVIVHDITSDLGVPTFRTYVVDYNYPVASGERTMVFFGMGTHPSNTIAVLRAITEAIQARLGFIQGARDSFNIGRARSRAATHRQRWLRLAHGPVVPFKADVPNDDVLTDLETLLSALRRSGFDRCIVADVTHPDIEIPVVRVRVPGLSAFCLNMRRIGLRCTRWLL